MKISLRGDSASSRIDAILFDLDGVLWDSNSFHEEALLETCKANNLELPAYESIAGMSTTRVFRELISAAKGDQSNLSHLVAQKQERFLESEHLISDSILSVTRLKSNFPDLLTGIVTGASRRTVSHFLNRCHDFTFDVVVTGEDTVEGKPSPAPYLLACHQLDIASSCCLAVEDSLSGLKAAYEAGAILAHIRDSKSDLLDCRPFRTEFCNKNLDDLVIDIESRL